MVTDIILKKQSPAPWLRNDSAQGTTELYLLSRDLNRLLQKTHLNFFNAVVVLHLNLMIKLY